MLLSIIIPVYNVEPYIRECFNSIIKQNFSSDVEIVVIDDGSTDNSGIICDEYAKKYKNIIVIHQENQGLSVVRNIGLSIAKGIYIAWIDPDDYIDENWYKVILSSLDDNNDIILFDYMTDNNGVLKKYKYKDKSQNIGREQVLYDLSCDQKLKSYLWQKVIKRELYENINFSREIKCMEDYAELHKIILKAENIYYISEYLYFYRVRENSLVNLVDFEKSYKCFLIAKDRYNYLNHLNIRHSPIAIFIHALGVYDVYQKIKDIDISNQYQSKFNECKDIIKKNIIYIIFSKDCDLILKIKFLLCYFNLFSVARKIYRWILK